MGLKAKDKMASKPENLVNKGRFLDLKKKKKIQFLNKLLKASQTILAVVVPCLPFIHNHLYITSFFLLASRFLN